MKGNWGAVPPGVVERSYYAKCRTPNCRAQVYVQVIRPTVGKAVPLAICPRCDGVHPT